MHIRNGSIKIPNMTNAVDVLVDGRTVPASLNFNGRKWTVTAVVSAMKPSVVLSSHDTRDEAVKALMLMGAK